jgi:nitronate monooxygenase
MSELLKRLGIEHPVIQAPMGGGPSTPELVAAVSNAGGLSSLGAAYLTPDQITDAVRRIRALTDKSFNVNLFAGGYEAERHVDPGPMLALLAEIHEVYGLPAPTLPVPPPDPFADEFEVVLAARPAVFSFTFGIPDRDVMARLRARGIAILGTATTIDEARVLAANGVDAIVAQGAEAGAHRGTFSGPFEAGMMVPTLELVGGILGAVSLPVIASCGIMDGRGIAAAMGLGASAAQLGTAFLTCPESGASEAYKQAILAARKDTTVITRAFSGRPARALTNTFIAKLGGRENTILPFPLQNALTRAMRTAAAERRDVGFMSVWAGRGVARARVMAAGELVRTLVEEMGEGDH